MHREYSRNCKKFIVIRITKSSGWTSLKRGCLDVSWPCLAFPLFYSPPSTRLPLQLPASFGRCCGLKNASSYLICLTFVLTGRLVCREGSCLLFEEKSNLDFQSFPYHRCDLVLLFNPCLRFVIYKVKGLHNKSIYLIWDTSGLSDRTHIKCLEQSLKRGKGSINVNIDVVTSPREFPFRRRQDLTERNGGIFQHDVICYLETEVSERNQKGDSVLSVLSSRGERSATADVTVGKGNTDSKQ